MGQGLYSESFGKGAVLDGRWKVGALIGEGGMGWVFHGTDLRTRRKVAIKTLNARALADEQLRLRFQREARTLERVKHAAVVRLLAHGGWEQTPWVVMEWVEGPTLGELMREANRHFTVRSLLNVVGQLAEALGHLHQAEIVYRDLKPDNVVVRPTAKVKLLDLGFARARGDPTLTAKHAAVGTPRYMAPEQCGVGGAVDHRADIYALGVIAWELCTGRPLFSAKSPIELMRAHLTTPPPDPQTIVPDIPNAVSGAIMRALQKDPARRPQTMAEFNEALRQTKKRP